MSNIEINDEMRALLDAMAVNISTSILNLRGFMKTMNAAESITIQVTEELDITLAPQGVDEWSITVSSQEYGWVNIEYGEDDKLHIDVVDDAGISHASSLSIPMEELDGTNSTEG